MSDEAPERPPAAGVVRALHVRRNAAAGAAVGVALAAGVYLVRVLELLGPVRGTQTYPVLGVGGWFLMLAVVLAAATTILVTAFLTLVSAVRLARRTAAGEGFDGTETGDGSGNGEGAGPGGARDGDR